MSEPHVSERDVRATFDQVVTDLPANPGRLGEVRGRVNRVRRRRSAAGAALAVLGLVASGVLVAHTGGRSPAPAVSNGPAMPEYRSGGRLVASAVSQDASGVAVTFTPTSLGLQVFSGCSTSDPAGPNGQFEMTVQVTVDGQPLSGGGCEPGQALTGLSSGIRSSDWAGLGVRVGQPVTISYTAAPGKSPHVTAWGLAVYQDVPLDAYVFPAAPTPLPTVGPDGSNAAPDSPPVLLVRGEGPATLPSSLTETTYKHDFRVVLKHGLTLQFDGSVPGDLVISVDGRQIWAPTTWTYGEEGAQNSWTLADLGLKPGEAATVSVAAHRYVGSTWRLAGYDQGS